MSAKKKATKKPARAMKPLEKTDYFMGPVPEGRVKELTGEVRALLGRDRDFEEANIMVDVSLSYWESDSSAEVIVDVSSTSRFIDLDAALDRATEVVKERVESLEVLDPKTGDKLPTIFERDKLRKHRACVAVLVRGVPSRSQLQVELYLSTNDPKREWKDDEDKGQSS